MSAWEVDDPSLVLVAGAGADALVARCFAAAERPAPDPAAVDARLAEPGLAALALPDLEPETVAPWLSAVKPAHLGLGVLALLPEARGPRQLLEARIRALGKRKVVDRARALPAAEAPELELVRRRLPCDLRERTGPFDVVGDVHGCREELDELLASLGYAPEGPGWRHPQGRTVVFVGDLCDRGPRNLDVLRGVVASVEAGAGLCVLGNHDEKLARVLAGRRVQVSPGLQRTLDELEALPGAEREAFPARARAFLEGLPSHLVLDAGRLVVAHGGIRADMIGRTGSKVSAFTRYGDPTGELDVHGHPVRRDWAQDYRGQARIVYGHTPTPAPRWVHRTANIDQGCCFGGRLTALSYPELTFAQVRARRIHYRTPGVELPPS